MTHFTAPNKVLSNESFPENCTSIYFEQYSHELQRGVIPNTVKKFHFTEEII